MSSKCAFIYISLNKNITIVIYLVLQSTPQTNRSQYSSPVEALNLIVESKSQPVALDNLTIELHVPSRRKKSLNHIVLWILISLLYLMTFDVTLRDDLSFGKLTNSCS